MFAYLMITSLDVEFTLLFVQAEDGIRDHCVTGVQTCALLISSRRRHTRSLCDWSSDVCSSDLDNTSTQLGTFSTSIVTTGSSWSVELMFLHSASQGVMGSCILSNGTNYGVTYETTGTKLSVDGTGNTAETTALTAGVWAHEVLTWDGTTSTFFRNGLPNGSGTRAGATAPATFDSWRGAPTPLNQTPSSIAWFRVWSRIVGQAEALDLFANPFAMVIVPAEDARTFAVLSGRRALVAPFPNLAMLFSPPPSSGVAITGTAFGTGAATALTISHAGTLEADGTGAATALTISHAGTFEADGSAA